MSDASYKWKTRTLNDGLEFRLENGLNAKIFRFDRVPNTAIREAWLKEQLETRNPPYFSLKHHAVCVQVGDETVWLLFFFDVPPRWIFCALQNEMAAALETVYAAIYQDTVYALGKRRIFTNAIITGVTPGIAGLLADWEPT